MNETYNSEYTNYQTNRNRFRRWGRQVYLRKASSLVNGPTLDFGCGIGELLTRLPSGSMGLEYNKTTISYCDAQGLDVVFYDGFEDDWCLSSVPKGRKFESMVISHVLEHLEEPEKILPKLLVTSKSFGVRTVLVIIPGKAGFKSDPTHRKFVDINMLKEVVHKAPGWNIKSMEYYPFNIEQIGNFFIHNELQVVLERE
ncbi:MAG: hypothetical protein K0S36_1235 [Nitrosospira multiformis]|jgi:hypothetical protein|nr:hypothetical protein [Nitrosospira multiformis]